MVPAAERSESSILVNSSPAAGSAVSGPVNVLKLRFNPPARLDEVTVSGPDGLMPMMIHPVGETVGYSIPLPALGPGSYMVNWRATTQTKAYRGSVSFTVK
jgi:methionine-rich copper-binding protein CopC